MNYDVGRVDRGARLLTDSAQVCALIKFIDATASVEITVTIRARGLEREIFIAHVCSERRAFLERSGENKTLMAAGEDTIVPGEM